MAAQWLEIGRIGSPFGVKGWVRIESFTEPPERVFEYRQWQLCGPRGDSQPGRVLAGREHGEGFIAQLEGIDDRDAAALLQGSSIRVDRSELPPLKAREHYQADLVGLVVKTLEGAELGVLRHFVTTPGGVVMVIQQADGREHWVPATPRHLSRVEMAEGRIVVDWPPAEMA